LQSEWISLTDHQINGATLFFQLYKNTLNLVRVI